MIGRHPAGHYLLWPTKMGMCRLRGCGFQAGLDSNTGFTIYYSRLQITRHLLGKSKSWESSSYREFKANNRKKETNEMGRRRSSSIMHTSLQGQQEICRYLERAIKQPSLINIINRAGQKKNKQKKQNKKRLAEKEKDKEHTVGLKQSNTIFF